MEFSELTARLADAACRGDGAALARLFTEDGVYHDVFYGTFTGRDEIERMIGDYFHRDAENFVWDFHDPVCQGDIGYVRYVFSYDSKLPDYAGKRSIFEGISIIRLKDGLIADYREVANAVAGLVKLGFPAERVHKILAKQAAELAGRDEATRHVRGT
jgi:ketosteroid isomerase-like protein